MTLSQAYLFGLLGVILGFLLWGRFRHDFVAAMGLLCGVILGVVPEDSAFEGFSNPAVLVVALVLIASRAFENSGALAVVSKIAAKEKRPIYTHIAILGGVGGALSAVINNVAALAILMPIDIEAARKAGRPPGLTLMPLAFATILGGMVTLIGTPSNIVASAVRKEQLGEPYGMFDFAPVGLTIAVAGILFVALIGWRLVRHRQDRAVEIDPSSFEAHLLVPEDSTAIGKAGVELEDEAEKADVILAGIIRNDRRRAHVMGTIIQEGDTLIVEGTSDAIAAFIKSVKLHEPETDETAKKRPAAAKRKKGKDDEEGEETPHAGGPEIVEAVVRSDSHLVDRSAASIAMRKRFGVTLLGIARSGTVSRAQISDRPIAAGDELLITGHNAASPATLDQLGLLPINRVSVARFNPLNAALAIGLFAAAILIATTGYLSFTITIAVAVTIYAGIGLVPARELYHQVDWPVVVMLACLLPLGTAFDRVGGTGLIANGIAGMTAEYSPVVALVAVMVVTMCLSDVLNNVATMVITGPIAVSLAQQLHVNPDTFLMGVAIAASCAFLTPIGHKNNTLIMGPGGFRFSDYWPMGLPLELVVLAVGIPTLLYVWPL